jgi:hypothetical protein
LELGRLIGPSSDSVYLTAHRIHLTASIPQSPDRREFGQQLFGGSEVEHPAGMHHPNAAAQLLEDAGLGGVSPAAGAAVAAGVAAPDRVDRPGILVVEVQLVEVQPELVIGHLDLQAATEASKLLLNQIQLLNSDSGSPLP